jgi:hypothetical protein
MAHGSAVYQLGSEWLKVHVLPSHDSGDTVFAVNARGFSVRVTMARCPAVYIAEVEGKKYTAFGLPSWSPTLVLTELDPA